MTEPTASQPHTHPILPLSTLLLMATACGLCAGANYFNQPLLHSMAQSLQISDALASSTVTMAQVSYGLGLLFLVPLGDMLERRRLVLALMLLAACGMLASGISGLTGSFALLAGGTLMAGVFSVAAQVLVPMAATFAAPGTSGRAVGLVMSGLLIGILASRSVAGILSDLGGWSTVYWAGAACTALMAVLLSRALPRAAPTAAVSYGAVMQSLAVLVRQHPRLRSRALIGGLDFATVSVLFSTMALLLAGPEFKLSDMEIGLIGIAGALMANVAGRMADKGLEQPTTLAGAVLLLLGWLALWLGGTSLWWFLVGMLVVDGALQALHISNQNVIYALAPQARSRINAVYMTTYFIGASIGSALGSWAWLHHGWSGTSLMGLALGLVTLAMVCWDRQLTRQQGPLAT